MTGISKILVMVAGLVLASRISTVNGVKEDNVCKEPIQKVQPFAIMHEDTSITPRLFRWTYTHIDTVMWEPKVCIGTTGFALLGKEPHPKICVSVSTTVGQMYRPHGQRYKNSGGFNKRKKESRCKSPLLV